MIGTKLGPYEITDKLGEGGMGEVYRATDSRLKRDVAIKVLPAAFTEDKERLARFEREAQLLAQLHHPNIASIFGLEESGGVRALVMELVEGPTLADRLESGPLSVAESLSLALQIAQALEEAHEKGIVHRDLKPQNIKASSEGRIKVLDFGLAKAMDPAGGSAAAADLARSPTIMNSPTLTAVHGTQLGVILGTAAYMAPEQARGAAVDKRADIWAFGVVFYEMLTGERLFEGDRVVDTLSAVMRKEIDLARLPESTPRSVRELLRRCLERNPKNRLHDIADARIVLEDALAGRADEAPVSGAAPAAQAPRSRALALSGWLAAALLAALSLVLAGRARTPQNTLSSVYRFTIQQPTNTLPNLRLVLSPDGRRLAFLAGDANGQNRIWTRPLDATAATPLPGTEDAYHPFWSPDSRSIAFFSHGRLRRVGLAGGAPQEICAAADGRGGSWSDTGQILFAPDYHGPLRLVAAAGGEPRDATALDPEAGEATHRWPFFLPGGERFLYFASGSVRSGIYAGSLDGKLHRRLLDVVSAPVFVPPDWLLFSRAETLFAQRFDPVHLALDGEPTPLVEHLGVAADFTGLVPFTASANGVLAFRGGGAQRDRLIWFDREGKELQTVGEPGLYANAALSPDERRIVFQVLPLDGAAYLSLMDLERGTTSRFSFEGSQPDQPVWSADGSRVFFADATKAGADTLAQKEVSGDAKAVPLLVSSAGLETYPDDASRDGRFLLYESFGFENRNDLWILPLGGDRKPTPYLRTPWNESHANFSPDSSFVAYASDALGRSEIFVQPFPGGAGRWQISTAGGDQPQWRRDGRELYYLGLDRRLMAVPVDATNGRFTAGEPRALFLAHVDAPTLTGRLASYQASADGQRFLVKTRIEDPAFAEIQVVVNWPQTLEKK